jgi:hypothetical protein
VGLVRVGHEGTGTPPEFVELAGLAHVVEVFRVQVFLDLGVPARGPPDCPKMARALKQGDVRNALHRSMPLPGSRAAIRLCEAICGPAGGCRAYTL